MMYTKDKTETIRLRVSSRDYEFLNSYAEKLDTSLSDVLRKIISDYRVSLSVLENMKTVAYGGDADGNE